MKSITVIALAGLGAQVMASTSDPVSLWESSLIDIYNASKTWPKCVSRDQGHIDCISLNASMHNDMCNGADHVNNPTRDMTAENFLAHVELFKASYAVEHLPTTQQGVNYYVAKKVVTGADPVPLHIMADLHGDVHTLLEHLHDLKEQDIIDDNFKLRPVNNLRANDHLVFLGDCGDSGDSSCEVWALLMRLRIANKNRCILVRGNHETPELANGFGFGNELDKKIGLHASHQASWTERVKPYYALFQYLPSAMFFGFRDDQKEHINYTCLSHAGLELGWRDHGQFLSNARSDAMALSWNRSGVMARNKAIAGEVHTAFQGKSDEQYEEIRPLDQPQDNIETGMPQRNGFMWNYYTTKDTDSSVYTDASGWTYGKNLTTQVLQSWSNISSLKSIKKSFNKLTMWLLGKKFLDATTYSVMANIRGHQHPSPTDFVQKKPYALGIKDMYLGDNKGLFSHWDKYTQGEPITPYSVFTLKNAACNVYGYPVQTGISGGKYLWYDNIGTRARLVLFNAYNWKLEAINRVIFKKDELHPSMQNNLIGLQDYLNEVD